MKVRLLLFAQYRDLAGHDALEIELPSGATAADLISRLRQDPRLHALPHQPVLAVNRNHARPSELLRDGDEVALLPPVAGG